MSPLPHLLSGVSLYCCRSARNQATDPGTYSSLVMHRAYLQLISGGGADDAAVERARRSRTAPSGMA